MLNNFGTSIVAAFWRMFDWLAAQFEVLASWVVDKLIDLIIFLFGLLDSLVEWFSDKLVSRLPDFATDGYSQLVPFFEVVRAYFPMEYFLLLMGAYFAIYGAAVGYKILLKLKQIIPAIG